MVDHVAAPDTKAAAEKGPKSTTSKVTGKKKVTVVKGKLGLKKRAAGQTDGNAPSKKKSK